MDITNLGTYASIDALWQAHPEGGKEGDYCTIGSVKHRWNKYDCIWENSETVTSSNAHIADEVDDLHVQNDLVVGGKIKGDISLVDLKGGAEVKEQADKAAEDAASAKSSAESAEQYASGINEALQDIIGMGDLPEGTAALAASTVGEVTKLSQKTDFLYGNESAETETLIEEKSIQGSSTLKYVDFSVNPNTKYRIKFSPKTWTMPDTTERTTAYLIQQHDNPNSTYIKQDKIVLQNAFASANDFDLTTLSNCKHIKVGLRGDGTNVTISVYSVSTTSIVGRVPTLESNVSNIQSHLYNTIALNVSGDKMFIKPDGTTNNASMYDISDYVDVESGEVIAYQGYVGSSGACIVGYDSSKTFVRVLLTCGDYTTNSQSIVIPNDVSFVRYCGRTDNYTLSVTKKTISINNDSWIKGKVVAIVGDSISTNGNSGMYCNVAEIEVASEDVGKVLTAYVTYNDVQNNLVIGGHTCVASDIGTELTFTPTSDDVGKKIGLPADYNKSGKNINPWWMIAKDELGFTPIPVCWSGSSISSHDLTATTYKDTKQFFSAHSWHPSQIRKMGVRTKGTTNRTAPDVVIIYRGTNDYSHKYNVVVNDSILDSNLFTIPSTDKLTEGNDYGFVDGYCMTIKAIREAYPNAKIILCTMNNFRRGTQKSAFPCNNGKNTLPQYNKAIRKIADYFGCGLIDFDKDGITFENCLSYTYDNASEEPTHPNNEGHKLMAKKAISDINIM